MTRRLAGLAGALAISLATATGCATQPDPCTPEWIEWKTDQILTRFARSHSGTVQALRDISGQVESPNALTAIRVATMIDDFEALAQDFDRIVMPELNDAIRLCGEPRNFVPAFSEFLRREGVGEDVIGWIEAIGYVAMEQRNR
ncbi:hypothetical protein [Henriciella aquimarina]|uniref:hypothetical protein n=1 Tax=Henriciella aquimarina TaxID=545261 RepID=UPI001301AF27|nr:hypothetical protein [Henriciella aquimarina]